MRQSEVERLREQFPKGTKVKCIHMNDPYHPVPSGTIGEVDHVDDGVTIHTRWQNGFSLGLIPGEDLFQKVSEPTKKKSKGHER